MSKMNTLAGWLKPKTPSGLNAIEAAPQAAKRKRSSVADKPIDVPTEDEEDVEEAPTKKPKVTKKAPAAKKSSSAKAPAKKSSGEAEKLYKKAIEDVDKKVGGLDARVKKMGPNSRSITSDTYAETMVKFSKDVEKLMALSPRLALNLLLHIGPHLHGDLDVSMKMSGYGGTEEPFAEMDDLMLEVIALRDDVPTGESSKDKELPEVGHRWTYKDADVGEFKTGRPNKQQRGQIERQRAAWIKKRNLAARQRREKVEDWVGNAVEELKGERDAIEDYGLKDYFKKSIVKLEELLAERN